MPNKAINAQIADVIFSLSRMMKDEKMLQSDTSQLTILQLYALIFISKQESVTMTEVAKQFKITLPTATALSDKLFKSNLIARQNDSSDRRIVKLVLTKKGKDLLAQAMSHRSAKINKMLSYLHQEEKEQLLHIMQTLVQAIQKNNEK
jgi:DNA-binding MarR family transcriptional regulator